jgi:hypothetical protein
MRRGADGRRLRCSRVIGVSLAEPSSHGNATCAYAGATFWLKRKTLSGS